MGPNSLQSETKLIKNKVKGTHYSSSSKCAYSLLHLLEFILLMSLKDDDVHLSSNLIASNGFLQCNICCPTVPENTMQCLLYNCSSRWHAMSSFQLFLKMACSVSFPTSSEDVMYVPSNGSWGCQAMFLSSCSWKCHAMFPSNCSWGCQASFPSSSNASFSAMSAFKLFLKIPCNFCLPTVSKDGMQCFLSN